MLLLSVRILRCVYSLLFLPQDIQSPLQTGGEGGHVFQGTETNAKEWDCILIYDEELGVSQFLCSYFIIIN